MMLTSPLNYFVLLCVCASGFCGVDYGTDLHCSRARRLDLEHGARRRPRIGPWTPVPCRIRTKHERRRLVDEPELALGRIEETGAALTRTLAATRVRPWAWRVEMGGA